MSLDKILSVYEKEAAVWAGTRDCSLWERPVLEAALAGQRAASVLDLGCGTGRPIARWFADQGARVTGVDGAPAMIARFRAALPQAQAVCSDMRGLALGARFDVIVAFNSFFHLSPDDQRAMFPIFAQHAAPGARLLLTTGPEASEGVMGRVGDSPVSHASLAPDEYRSCMARSGFSVLWFRPQDPQLRHHSVWLAKFSADADRPQPHPPPPSPKSR